MKRRAFIGGGSALVATVARAQPAAPAIIAQYEAASGGQVGVFAENTGTGQRFLWRADDRFVMCSTFKASLAALVLHRADLGRDRLDARVRFGPSDLQDWRAPVARANLSKGELSVQALCAAAVEESDNTCANLLLARVGGPAGLTDFWRELGDATSRLDGREPELNRTPPGGVENTTTPRAMAGTLKALALGDVLSPPSRSLFVSWLEGCKTGAHRLRAGLPGTWRIGDKTGNNGLDAAGDIAVAWPPGRPPLIFAVYTRGGQPTEAQLAALFADLGRQVAEKLGASNSPIADLAFHCDT